MTGHGKDAANPSTYSTTASPEVKEMDPALPIFFFEWVLEGYAASAFKALRVWCLCFAGFLWP